MTSTYSSRLTKKLAFRCVLENIDHNKRSASLQDIISLGKTHDIWRQALVLFLDTPVTIRSFRALTQN